MLQRGDALPFGRGAGPRRLRSRRGDCRAGARGHPCEVRGYGCGQSGGASEGSGAALRGGGAHAERASAGAGGADRECAPGAGTAPRQAREHRGRRPGHVAAGGDSFEGAGGEAPVVAAKVLAVAEPVVAAPAAPEPVAPPARIGPLATLEMVAGAVWAAPPPADPAPPPPEPAPPEPAPAPNRGVPAGALRGDRRIPRRKGDKTAILERHELTEERWSALAAHWEDAIQDGLKRGRSDLLATFDAAYVDQLEAERGSLTVDDYARLAVSAERGTSVGRARGAGPTRGAMQRIQRVWLKKMGKSPGAREERTERSQARGRAASRGPCLTAWEARAFSTATQETRRCPPQHESRTRTFVSTPRRSLMQVGPSTRPGRRRSSQNGHAQARATNQCTCTPPAPVNFIVTGAAMVLVDGKPAARMTDKTMHPPPGLIASGSPDILIGGPTIGVSLGAGADGALRERSGGARLQSQHSNPTTTAVPSVAARSSSRPPAEKPLRGLPPRPGHGRRQRPKELVETGEFEIDNVKDRQAILNNGVTSTMQDSSMDNVMQAVAEKKGVITAHRGSRHRAPRGTTSFSSRASGPMQTATPSQSFTTTRGSVSAERASPRTGPAAPRKDRTMSPTIPSSEAPPACSAECSHWSSLPHWRAVVRAERAP